MAYRAEPPDGGWGWMVVLSAFFQSALVFGVLRSFGVFFVEFVAAFEEPAARVSWIASIGIAVQQFGSECCSWVPRPSEGSGECGDVKDMGRGSGAGEGRLRSRRTLSSPGPVGSALSTKFGPRPVVMTGGILAALGMLLASFATSLTHLYLSIGLLSGETLSRAGESKPESFWPQDFYFLPAPSERLKGNSKKVLASTCALKGILNRGN